MPYDVIRATVLSVENQDETRLSWSMCVSATSSNMATDTTIELTPEQIKHHQRNHFVIQSKLTEHENVISERHIFN